MEWNGMERKGMEWIRIEWDGIELSRTEQNEHPPKAILNIYALSDLS